jgi:hypothetical protein
MSFAKQITACSGYYKMAKLALATILVSDWYAVIAKVAKVREASLVALTTLQLVFSKLKFI